MSKDKQELTVKRLSEFMKYIFNIVSVCGAVFFSINRAMNEKIDSKIIMNNKEIYTYINTKDNEIYAYVDDRTTANSNYIERERIINIHKQYSKLTKDQTDVKIIDIEKCIYDWDYINLGSKDPQLRKEYNEIKRLYDSL